MEQLAGFVPVIVKLLLDKLEEETLRRMPMIAAATSVFFFGHSGYESFCLVKGILNGLLPDQALQEFLIEFESA